MRVRCVVCGTSITKSSKLDAYLCRPCSYDGEGVRRYMYLDKHF